MTKTLIPQTRLRRFYESLRLFPEQLIHISLAKYMCRTKGKCLQELFQDSYEHFCKYNCPLPFHNRSDPDWNRGYLDRSAKFAKCLQARLEPGKNNGLHEVFDAKQLKFHVLDYEISPYRTPNAVFEDGKSGKSSGVGGLDLLLCNCEDKTPIIGEVKAKDDTNMLLALVQALVYVSELVTPHQRQRLLTEYGARGLAFSDQTKCDIYLMYQNDHEGPDLLEHAVEIAKALLVGESAVSKYVRRIAFIQAALTDNSGVKFHSRPEDVFTS